MKKSCNFVKKSHKLDIKSDKLVKKKSQYVIKKWEKKWQTSDKNEKLE